MWMMEYRMKRKVLFGMILLVLVLVPSLINLLVLVPMPGKWNYPIAGKPVDWLHFWASYLGAIASFIMIVYTGMSLRQNRRQLDEMKRQWNEEHRARLIFSLVSKDGLIVLRISNVGKDAAYNIMLKFSDEFVESLILQYLRDLYAGFKHKSFSIGAGESKYFFLSGDWGDNGVHYLRKTQEEVENAKFIEWLNAYRSMQIKITGIYNDEFPVNETLRLEDYFFGSLDIRNDLINDIASIRKGLVQNNDQYATIQQSLDRIAKALEK